MTVRSVVRGASLTILLAGLASAAGSLPVDRSSIDAVLRGAVEQGKIPGVVAMVATPDAVVYQGAFGKRDVAQGVAMTEDTIFRIFSMTKPVTSVAALQLVEQGKLSLDEPVKKLLPAVGSAKVLEASRNGEPQLRPATTAITLRQLLTHTAGYAYGFLNQDLRDYLVKRGLPPLVSGDEGPLVFEPGTRWQYGTSVDTAGRLVENVSGLSLEEYFRRNIFQPLGMNDSFYNVPAAGDPRMASLHQRQADGSLHENPRKPPAPTSQFSGGGGLASTAADYIKFMQMLLHEGSLGKARILKPETVAMMSRNQIGNLEAGHLKTVMPEFSSDVDFYPGIVHKFGFGFLINTAAYQGSRSAGSLAWAGAANTYFWIDPERKLCAVILMQILPFFDGDAVAVLRGFERAVYAGRSSR
jgi:CubicO group peptidase (beta-lactamase class C family)